MNKVKVLTIVVIIQFCLNVPLLILFWQAPKPVAGKSAIKQVIIQKLKFDDKQILQYEALITQHIQEIKEVDKAISQNKDALYRTLIGNDTLQKDAIINEIIKAEAKVEHIHYRHFWAIKQLCKPEQIDDFNKLTQEIAQVLNKKQ